MDVKKEAIVYEEMIKWVVELKSEEVKRAINKGLEEGIDALSIQENGLRKGLERIGDLFETGEYFIPHLMLGAKIFTEGVEILKPFILKSQPSSTLGTAVIGTVFGDLHDLGKNLVAMMWEVSGFKVIDLGTNVPIDAFLNAIDENSAKILGLSTLLTTTMIQQRKVIEALIEANMKDSVKVIVGGAVVTEEWAKEIMADGYAENVGEAVRIAKKVIGKD